MPSVAPARRRPLRALARAASWHRRKLAVLAAIAAVLTGISAAAPEGPAMITVVKAKSQLPGGTVVSASDLVLDRVVAADAPKGWSPIPWLWSAGRWQCRSPKTR